MNIESETDEMNPGQGQDLEHLYTSRYTSRFILNTLLVS